jgi:hypothetical protein
MSEPRQCGFCGRKGTRAFVALPGSSYWLCKAGKACRLRRDRSLGRQRR